MNHERLLLLANFLETKVPAGRWDYRHIVGEGWGGAQDLSCGTTGCAIGWAASIPELAAAGMRLVVDPDSMWSLHGLAVDETFRNAEKVFDLTEDEAEFLFVPYPPSNADGHLTADATAADVAEHIRAFVERGGMR